MLVPFCDIGRENEALATGLTEAFERVRKSGRVLYGDELEAFEREIAEWHGVRFAVGVASGTDAVEVALRAATNETGGVTVTAMTAVPTINAMEAAGMGPLLVDCHPLTRNAAAYAGLAVHLYGLASLTGATPLVEDVAHSMGATVGSRLAGTMGDCGALSFYPSKIMGTLGDGGCIITNDPVIADRARKIRHYGFDDDGDVVTRGQNSRLCEMQAAFLRVKLPHVHGWIDRRREIAARYTEELKGRVVTPCEPPSSKHVYHCYVIESEHRDMLKAKLTALGVGTMVHYPRAIHQYDRWRGLGEKGSFPVAEKLAATVLSLPCYPYLRDDEQDWVIKAVKECA